MASASQGDVAAAGAAVSRLVPILFDAGSSGRQSKALAARELVKLTRRDRRVRQLLADGLVLRMTEFIGNGSADVHARVLISEVMYNLVSQGDEQVAAQVIVCGGVAAIASLLAGGVRGCATVTHLLSGIVTRICSRHAHLRGIVVATGAPARLLDELVRPSLCSMPNSVKCSLANAIAAIAGGVPCFDATACVGPMLTMLCSDPTADDHVLRAAANALMVVTSAPAACEAMLQLIDDEEQNHVPAIVALADRVLFRELSGLSLRVAAARIVDNVVARCGAELRAMTCVVDFARKLIAALSLSCHGDRAQKEVVRHLTTAAVGLTVGNGSVNDALAAAGGILPPVVSILAVNPSAPGFDAFLLEGAAVMLRNMTIGSDAVPSLIASLDGAVTAIAALFIGRGDFVASQARVIVGRLTYSCVQARRWGALARLVGALTRLMRGDGGQQEHGGAEASRETIMGMLGPVRDMASDVGVPTELRRAIDRIAAAVNGCDPAAADSATSCPCTSRCAAAVSKRQRT